MCTCKSTETVKRAMGGHLVLDVCAHVCTPARVCERAQGWPACTNIGCGVGLRDTRGSGGTWSQPDTLRGRYNRKYRVMERAYINPPPKITYDGKEEERKTKHKDAQSNRASE